jgi:DNA-binding HxlR family transcriptional regulator
MECDEECVQLTARESSVCELICRGKGDVTFGVLKKKSELHQEILSRIVTRLQRYNLVQKVDGRYKKSHCCGQNLSE